MRSGLNGWCISAAYSASSRRRAMSPHCAPFLSAAYSAVHAAINSPRTQEIFSCLSAVHKGFRWSTLQAVFSAAHSAVHRRESPGRRQPNFSAACSADSRRWPDALAPGDRIFPACPLRQFTSLAPTCWGRVFSFIGGSQVVCCGGSSAGVVDSAACSVHRGRSSSALTAFFLSCLFGSSTIHVDSRAPLLSLPFHFLPI